MNAARAATVLIALLFSIATASGHARQPNVLFVLIDDLRPVTASFGGPISAPNLDGLAERGVRFLNNYANVPVCGASRASMLSGLAPTASRFLTFNSRLDVDAPAAVSLPAFFKDAGWYTVANGKVFDTIADSAGSWSEPVWNPAMRWHSPVKNDGRGEHLQKSYIADPGWGRPPAFERQEIGDDGYPDGEITIRSAQDIARLSELDQPFFLAVGFRKPHLPFNAPAAYWREETPESEYLAATWTTPTVGIPERAYHRSLELRMQYDALPLLGDASDRVATDLVMAYHAATRYVDALLGQLVASLEASGVADQTIIVVAGDHGFLLGEQRMWTKHALFDTALRTPLIIVDPDRTGSRSVNAVTDLLDVFPTLADLAGLPPPAGLDGVSLRPLMDNPDMAAHPEKPVSISRWLDGESVRDQSYRFTAWFGEDGLVVDRMLFNLVEDPHETSNIASLAESQEVVTRLEKVLVEHRAGNRWSPELAALVDRLAFAGTTIGVIVVAVMRQSHVAGAAVAVLAVLVLGWFVYRRVIRRRN